MLHRFGQLPQRAGWAASLAALRAPAGADDTRTALADLVAAATARYLTHGHASPVLLVHTATAPNAVLHTLPALPEALWAPSLSAVWAASAAIVSTYAPVHGADPADLPAVTAGPDAVDADIDRAVSHGDEQRIRTVG